MPEILPKNTPRTTQSAPPAAYTPGGSVPLQRSQTKRNALIIAFVIILITVAIAVTAIFDVKNFPSIPKFLQNVRNITGSDDAAKHVLESLFSIKTADISSDFVTEGPMFSSTSPVTSNISGSFDPKGGEDGSFAFTYNIKNSNQNTFAPTSFELINVASNTYFRATGLPNIFIITAALNGNWIDLSANVKNANFRYPKLNKDELLQELKNDNAVKLSKNLGSEEVNGIATNHYELTIQKDGLAAFAKVFAKEINPQAKDEDVQKIVDAITFERVEVWVGVKDFFPYKILMQVETKKNADVHVEDGSLSATIIFSKLNEAKDIKKPANALTLPAALSPQIQGLVGGLFDKAIGTIFQQFPKVEGLPDTDGDGVNDASEIVLGTDPNKQDSNNNGVSDRQELSAKLGDERDSDADGLADSVETLFGTDPTKADTDSDGFKDGEEVINGFNPKGAGKLFP